MLLHLTSYLFHLPSKRACAQSAPFGQRVQTVRTASPDRSDGVREPFSSPVRRHLSVFSSQSFKDRLCSLSHRSHGSHKLPVVAVATSIFIVTSTTLYCFRIYNTTSGSGICQHLTSCYCQHS